MKYSLLCFFVVINSFAFAQSGVSINITKAPPDPSAMLDVSSINKGLLIPRISLDSAKDKITIPNPAKSLVVYNTNLLPIKGLKGAGIYYNQGTAQAPDWIKLAEVAQVASPPSWLVGGNADIFNPHTQFLGTTNNVDVVLKRFDEEAFRISPGGSILARGNTTTGKVPASGIGTKLFWSPAKAAFRAGSITFKYPENWDEDSVGTHSFAVGQDSKATKNYSFAAGKGAAATGESAIAMGEFVQASGHYSTALGGNINDATGDYSVSMGYSTQANGMYATALGNNSTASGESSTALGNNTAAKGDRSTAMGRFTTANAYASTTLGLYNDNGDANVDGTVSSATNRIFQLGNGDQNLRKNALTILKNGNIGTGGVTNPLAQLHMRSANTNSWNSFIRMENTSINKSGYIAYDGTHMKFNNDNSTGNFFFYINDEPVFYIDNDYSVFKGGSLLVEKDFTVYGKIHTTDLTVYGDFNDMSDIRLKENIHPLNNVLEKISTIQPITYYYKDKKVYRANKQIGFSAQEIEKTFPELVKKEKDGYLSVNYIHLTAVAIQAIKEQQEIIDDQKNALHNYENKISDLSDQLKSEKNENELIKKRLEAIEILLKSK